MRRWRWRPLLGVPGAGILILVHCVTCSYAEASNSTVPSVTTAPETGNSTVSPSNVTSSTGLNETSTARANITDQVPAPTVQGTNTGNETVVNSTTVSPGNVVNGSSQAPAAGDLSTNGSASSAANATGIITTSSSNTSVTANVTVAPLNGSTQPPFCSNSTCKHGSCSSRGCICSVGWRGDNCNEDVDECAMGVCINSDLCTNLAGNYSCLCKNGWTGQNCSKDVDECLNRSSCIDVNSECNNTEGSFTCTCKNGFERLNDMAKCTEIVIIPYNTPKTSRVTGNEELIGPISIPQSFPFNGKTHPALFVSINGYVIFDRWLNRPYKPANESVLEGLSIIAPYWTDIEIPSNSSTSGLFHLELSLEDTFTDNETKILFDEYKAKIQEIVKNRNISGDLNPTYIAIFTWANVLPYKAEKFANMQMATLQLVLLTDGFQSIAIISYRTVWPQNEHLKVDAYISSFSLAPINRLNEPDRRIVPLSNESLSSTNAACLQWRLNSRSKNYTGMACPCSLDQAKMDRLFTVPEGQPMAQSKVWNSQGIRQYCYYDSNNMLVTNLERIMKKPIKFHNASVTKDLEDGLNQCCTNASSLCYRVYEVFPVGSCTAYTPPRTALIWGNMYVFTLDGSQFTFSGWGEYVLLRTADRSLEIQGRTSIHENLNVTVLTAVAIKAGDPSVVPVVEIQLSNASQVQLYFNGLLSKPNFTSDIVLQADNHTVNISVTPGLTFEVAAGSDRLSLTLYAPPGQLSNASGLLGYTDGNATNDFLLRNGTSLAGQLMPELIYQFGQSWMLMDQNESLFNYTQSADGNFSSYHQRNFTPRFLPSSVDETLLSLNETGNMGVGAALCNTSLACLQEFLLTKNNQSALEVKMQQEVLVKQRELLGRRPPQFQDLSPWNISVGVFRRKVEVTTDAQTPIVNYTIVSEHFPLNYSFVQDQTSGELTWYVSSAIRNMSAVPLAIQATDEHGLIATFQPNIVVCACELAEQCSYTASLLKLNSAPQTDFFYLAECQCGDGQAGRWCDKKVDACQICYPNAMCNTMANASICQACPSGYEGNGIQCFEVDECLGDNECEQNCQNTIGNYTCSCQDGFKLVGSGKCLDIDECVENTTICSEPQKQFCSNTNGSFTCLCRPGYGGKDCSTKVSHVYGGQIVFAAVQNQAWSDDLNNSESQTFKKLAQRVSDQIFAILRNANVTGVIGVNVLKFVLQKTSGVQKRSADSVGKPKIVAIFSVDMESSQNSSMLGMALDTGYNPLCTGIDCSLGELVGVCRSCTKFDETFDLCQSNRLSNCHNPSTTCRAYSNGTWSCPCRSGYEPWSLYDNACTDVDECLQNSTENLCGQSGAKCNNLPGTYNCTCTATYRWTNTDTKCALYDYCQKNPCYNDAECINKLEPPGYACRCKYGWTGPMCDTEDEKAAEMQRTVIGLAAGLGAFCFILLLVIIVMCVIKSKRKGSHYTSSHNGTYSIPRPYLGSGSDMEMSHRESLHKYTDFRSNTLLDVDDEPPHPQAGSHAREYDNCSFVSDEHLQNKL